MQDKTATFIANNVIDADHEDHKNTLSYLVITLTEITDPNEEASNKTNINVSCIHDRH